MYDLLRSPKQSQIRSLLLAGAVAGMAFAATVLPAQNYPPQNGANGADVPPPTARLARLQGNVSVQPDGVDSWGAGAINQPLSPGDRVYTDQDGEGEIQTSLVRAYFSAGTDLTLTNLNEQGIEFGLASGSANIYSDGFQDGQSLFVSTPNGGMTLAGRGNFRVDVYPDQQSTVITVSNNSDQLVLNGAGNFNMTLYRGQSIQLSGTNPVYTQPLEPAADDAFAHWSSAIESHRFNSVSARYVSPEMQGYDDLDNAGDWQPQSDYGPVWYPRVEAGWAPYRNGHWVNRPYYGWTWVADEPWGAAPFHYGRWVQIGGRWGWIPGPREVRPVWSPAQVVFAGGIQVGGVGVSVWFPLGPGEAYRPWYPCSPQYIDRVNMSNIRETRVVHVEKTYVNIVNVTNITYVNRTNGAVAMRHDDFANGHSAKTNFVRVDPRQVEHIQPQRPDVKPPAQPIILRPVAKPIAVKEARPVLINHQGEAAPAAPNAKPAPVPVKTTPPVAPRPIPGRAPIGTPTVGGKPVAPTAPVVNPARPGQPAPAPAPAPVRPIQPAPTPINPTPAPNPGANRPVPPGNQPPVTPARPGAPTPTPVNPPRPPAQPPVKIPPPQTEPKPLPPTTIEPKPVPPAVRPQPVVPPARTVPPDQRPVPPATRPIPPANVRPVPAPPAKNAPKPDERKKPERKEEDKKPQ